MVTTVCCRQLSSNDSKNGNHKASNKLGAPHRDEYKGRFEEHAPDIWETLVKSGSINIQRTYDERGLISYCLKEQYKDQNFQSFIISTEFSSK